MDSPDVDGELEGESASEDVTEGGRFGFGPACDEDQPSVWRDSASGQCYLVDDEWLSWDVAQATCESQGGYLAIIENAHEQVFVSEILWQGTPDAAVYTAWVGLSRAAPGAPFTFVDGTIPEQPQWHAGQPDAPDDRSCAYISEEDAWRWHDTHCDATHPYVCEWTPEPA